MMTVSLIALIVVLILVVMVISTKNSIKTSSNQVDEAFSTMDVYLKKRHDLIPNLVNTAKGYAAHESETLEKIANISAAAAGATNPQQIISDEQKLDSATNHLFAIAQAYPELKANENFNNLMNQLQRTEEDIANARKYYNASVRQFNDKISTFPGSMFASGEEPKPYFQVSSEADRQNVNVNF